MVKKVHKIIWEKRWHKFGKDLEIEVVDIDCMVYEISHPCGRWAVGEHWFLVCRWFQSKGAKVILDYKNAPNNDLEIKG